MFLDWNIQVYYWENSVYYNSIIYRIQSPLQDHNKRKWLKKKNEEMKNTGKLEAYYHINHINPLRNCVNTCRNWCLQRRQQLFRKITIISLMMSEYLAGVSSSLRDISLIYYSIVVQICVQTVLFHRNNKVKQQICAMIRFRGENLQTDNITL